MAVWATTVLRVGGCLLLLALLGTTGSRVDPLSAEQQELVDFGLSRFEAQGLALPDVRFKFHSSVMQCGGHLGKYHHGTGTVTMCSLDKGTMLHELAHAWADITLTEQDRKAFVELRGLSAWNDRSQPWKDRGTEQTAEVIAWALLDEPNALLFLSDRPDGSPQPEFRLLSIGNSSVESLHEAFVVLTGMEPVFRSPSEWDSESLYVEWKARMPTTSPEARP